MGGDTHTLFGVGVCKSLSCKNMTIHLLLPFISTTIWTELQDTPQTKNNLQLGIKRVFAVYHVFWTLLVERLIIMFHIDHSSLL